MMLPLNPNFEEKNTLENEKFYIDGMEIKNPFISSNNMVNNVAILKVWQRINHWKNIVLLKTDTLSHC